MHAPAFDLPPRLTDDEGNQRRVGLEIEFGGVSLADAATLVQQLYGGKVVEENRFRSVVSGTRLGDFVVELDSNPLKAQRHRALVPEVIADAVEEGLERLARRWIPIEVGAPPVPIADLPELEALRRGLYALHAQGTRASVLYAFGFQLNADLPSKRADSLLAHLRAFLVLADWIVAVSEIDLTRRLSAFVEPFPDAYRRKVLDPAYAPDLDALIDDYLLHNATRNRALDMLPAFCLLRPEKVRAAVKDPEAVHPRPTFHYRLPNCLLDNPSWSFATDWNHWVTVERLADDAPRLAALCSELLVDEGDPGDRRTWIGRVQRYVEAQ